MEQGTTKPDKMLEAMKASTLVKKYEDEGIHYASYKDTYRSKDQTLQNDNYPPHMNHSTLNKDYQNLTEEY